MKTLLIFLLLVGPVYATDIAPPPPIRWIPVHHTPPGPIWWAQPMQPQPIIYPTPLRNFFFGTHRLAPVGPPIPYRWVPGQWVPLQELPQ